jgi:hypothetical protein
LDNSKKRPKGAVVRCEGSAGLVSLGTPTRRNASSVRRVR